MIYINGLDNIIQFELRCLTYKEYSMITLSKTTNDGDYYWPIITLVFNDDMDLYSNIPEDLDILNTIWNNKFEYIVSKSAFYEWRNKDYYDNHECFVGLTIATDKKNRGLFIHLTLPNTRYHWVIDFNTMEFNSYDKYCYNENNWETIYDNKIII